MLSKIVADYAKKLNYKLFQAPKGYGLPVRTEVWDQQFQEGVWAFLDTVDELPNYMVTIGYIRHFAGLLGYSPRLLDLGCGQGNLADLLSGFRWKSYLGLDVSTEAIRQAKSRQIKNAGFEVKNFEEWEPNEIFDVIISTGSICYAANPVALLRHYAKFLSEKGVIIISLWRYSYNGVIWQNIEKHFEVVDSTVVTNAKGQIWDIKVLRHESVQDSVNTE